MNILQLNVMFTVVKHIKGFLKAEVLNLSKLYYIDLIESPGLGLFRCLLSALWVSVSKFFTRFESVNQHSGGFNFGVCLFVRI